MAHLTIRVPWHDRRWDGHVCSDPALNSYCLVLDRIRKEKNDEAEGLIADRSWSDIPPPDLPPCAAESGAFMSPNEWTRVIRHPYQEINPSSPTHGHLKPTLVKVPEFSANAVPFRWMLRSTAEELEERVPGLPEDDAPPFETAWVFGARRQEAISRAFFRQVVPGSSLVFLYTKDGHPLGEGIPRLIVGVGAVTDVAPPVEYDRTRKGHRYLAWDRPISHSIRPEGAEGFVLPFHDYLIPTGDPVEDERRQSLIRELIVEPERSQIATFSYASEHASDDVALSMVVKLLRAVRAVREHGIADGPWEQREEWLNGQLARLWTERGPFPGLGSALEALGLRMATALIHELVTAGDLAVDRNPWDVIDELLRERSPAPKSWARPHLAAAAPLWQTLPDERRALLELLARFALSPEQAKRWYDPDARREAIQRAVPDAAILENPYLIAELDAAGPGEEGITLGVIDRGLLPEGGAHERFPLGEPSRVISAVDSRRLRAAVVTVLRAAGDEGDSLLSARNVRDRVSRLELHRACDIPPDWPPATDPHLDEAVKRVALPVAEADEVTEGTALQLVDHWQKEDFLRRLLVARAERELDPLDSDWDALLVETLRNRGIEMDPADERHAQARDEQVAALRVISSRRLSVLTGRAGTGKMSVLGALTRDQAILGGGVLLLAPTGKARVRLSRSTERGAHTIAQFLLSLDRYDPVRQRPLFDDGAAKSKGFKTVVIDESSMLTMDDLVAVLLALDLGAVERVILVGDPNQLPPIGVGRPFADFVGHLESLPADDPAKAALAQLTTEVRTFEGQESDTLRLASWFAREPQPVDADRVLSDVAEGASLNDLEIRYWQSPEQLREEILSCFVDLLGLKHTADLAGFERLLGFDDRGRATESLVERVEGSVKSQGALRKRSWGSRRDRWASRRSHLREQRTPTRRKEPPLLSERHRVASPAAPAEVLPQLVERRAEARRRREAPEAAHRVVPLLHRAMVLLHEVV